MKQKCYKKEEDSKGILVLEICIDTWAVTTTDFQYTIVLAELIHHSNIIEICNSGVRIKRWQSNLSLISISLFSLFCVSLNM